MTKKLQLRVGQTLYFEPAGWSKRYGCEIVKRKVSYVGKDYFTLKGMFGNFYFEKMDRCWPNHYCYRSSWNIYFQKQDGIDKNEKAEIQKSLCELFQSDSYNDLSLSQLRKIQKIAFSKG